MRNVSKGSVIAIVAPAGRLSVEVLHRAIETLTQEGYKVEVMPHVDGYGTSVFSATDEQRASDLRQALEREDIDAVMCARGGYGAMRTLQLLPREVIENCGKWLVGFSDITVLHSALSKAGIPSVHGPMLKHIATHGFSHDDVRNTFAILRGESLTIEVPRHELSRYGRAEGVLVGGNLSIIYSLRGTPAETDYRGKILFIEDLCEYNYHIDRMMQNLRYSGVLKQLSGLIVGQFTDMKDGATPFGRSAYEIIHEAVSEYDYPVLFGYPAGHADEENQPLVMGRTCRIDDNRVIFA